MARIVLIEDDPWMADCYITWLSADGHQVRHLGDAYDAIDAIDDNPPQLILLDLFLPHANGIQLLHTLRSHVDLAHIPVVLCSSSLPGHVPDVSAYGVHKVVAKSTLNPHSINHLVGEVLAHAAV